MCERLKQAVLKLACLLPPVFGINHLELANAALFGLDTGVRHANMQRIMQRWIGKRPRRFLHEGAQLVQGHVRRLMKGHGGTSPAGEISVSSRHGVCYAADPRQAGVYLSR